MKNNFLDNLDGNWSNVISDTYIDNNPGDINFTIDENEIEDSIMIHKISKENVLSSYDLFNNGASEDIIKYKKKVVFNNFKKINAKYKSLGMFGLVPTHNVEIKVLYEANDIKVDNEYYNDEKYIIVTILVCFEFNRLDTINVCNKNIYTKFITETDHYKEIFSKHFYNKLDTECKTVSKNNVYLIKQ